MSTVVQAQLDGFPDRALLAKILAAEDTLQQTSRVAGRASQQLETFNKQVEALAGKKIPVETAEFLRDQAGRVQTILQGGGVEACLANQLNNPINQPPPPMEQP